MRMLLTQSEQNKNNKTKVEMRRLVLSVSLDPVALDQACVDIVFNKTATEGNDNAPLKERISSRHGTHTIDHAEKIGLGSKTYTLVNIDK